MDLAELLGVEQTEGLDRARAILQADRELLRDLVSAREEAGLTQSQVGDRMGISQSAVARIEAGRRDLRMSTLRRYVHAVEASVRYLVVTRSQTEAAAATVRGLEAFGHQGDGEEATDWRRGVRASAAMGAAAR